MVGHADSHKYRAGPRRPMNRRRVTRRAGRRWTRRIVRALGVYLIVCVLVSLIQSRLLYFPRRDYDADPTDVGLAFEDLTLTTADGVALAAWYIPHDNPRGTLIFCHGNAGNIADRLGDVQLLHGMRLNVLMFDYRGFGRSTGRPTEQGTYEDAETVWRYLVETRRESPQRIVVFGRSLGGAVAIELAGRRELAGLIIESSFTNIVDIGRLHYWFLPVSWIVSYRYASIDKIPHITCPKIFFHGTDDRLIPIEYGRRLFEAAAEPKRFVETPGEHHTAGYSYSPQYSIQLVAFLKDVLPE